MCSNGVFLSFFFFYFVFVFCLHLILLGFFVIYLFIYVYVIPFSSNFRSRIYLYIIYMPLALAGIVQFGKLSVISKNFVVNNLAWELCLFLALLRELHSD